MTNETGVNEEYKALVEKLEREKHGMYDEMKAEREKRQALEEKMGRMEQEMESRRVTSSSDPQDENLKWVTEFAKDGRKVLTREFDGLVKPLRETNDKLVAEVLKREALDWVADEEGTTVSKLRKSDTVKELDRIARERNLGSLPIVARAQAAYEFLKLERKQKEEAEKARSMAIENNGTQSVSTSSKTPSGTGRIWKESEIAAMDLATFQAHSKDITLARSEGRFVLDMSKLDERGKVRGQA